MTHVPFEDAANIEAWARDRGYYLDYTRLYENKPLPRLDSFEMLSVMGGPMGINDHDTYPWLIEEKEFLKNAIKAGKKIIGICLGAQLLANVLGGKVVKNSNLEIGWYPVILNDQALETTVFAELPEEFTAFHWHGDTFSTPDDCVHLARSACCENQAFVYENHVLGMQFHLEYTRESIEKMLWFCKKELVDGPYIQGKKEITERFEQIKTIRSYLYSILDAFTVDL